MVQRRGPRLTAAQKAEVWRRWRDGESLNAIGRALGRIPKMVHYIVAGAGGIPPVPRRRARQALTLSEREAISRGVARGSSLRQISRDLGRAPSTVSREVRRHGGAPVGIGPRPLTGERGPAPDVRSAVAWRRTRCCVGPSPRSLRASGRRSRSPVGSVRRILRIRPCTCRTRRSISACSYRAAAC